MLKSERTEVVTMLCLRGTPGVEWGRGSARVLELQIFEESAKEVPAGRHLWEPIFLLTASTTRLDQSNVFCDPEKRGAITTWPVAGTRAKSSCDRQLQQKQPFCLKSSADDTVVACRSNRQFDVCGCVGWQERFKGPNTQIHGKKNKKMEFWALPKHEIIGKSFHLH